MATKFILFLFILMFTTCGGRYRNIQLRVDYQEHIFEIITEGCYFDSVIVAGLDSTYCIVSRLSDTIQSNRLSLIVEQKGFKRQGNIDNVLASTTNNKFIGFRIFAYDKNGKSVYFSHGYDTTIHKAMIFENIENFE